MEVMAAFIGAHRREETPVFVHCTAGINRSGLVLGYFLCSREGLTGEQAIDLIRSERKSHGTPMKPLCNASFAEALRSWFPGGAA
jgi:protein-tyrosine phosphatase